MKKIDIILASGSPRRRELMAEAGYEYKVITSDVSEETDETDPTKYVMELSSRKAKDVAEKKALEYLENQVEKRNDEDGKAEAFAVIGADTVVALNGRILGKPCDYEDAYNTIKSLAGQTHQVYTGVTIIFFDGKESHAKSFFECTDVTFYPMSHEEIVWYLSGKKNKDNSQNREDENVMPAWVNTQSENSWADKAGSYGIQDPFGMTHIKEIKGDYYNVVGLPVARLYKELKEMEAEYGRDYS